MLNMNSESRRVSKQHHKKMLAADISAEMQNEHDVEAGNPLVLLMYEFLTVPSSSRVAYFWALTTCWMVIVRILAIGLESCDGPNQYYNRPTNNARFKFLLTEPEYWDIYIAVMVPLIIDTFARVVTLAFVCFGDENAEIFDILKSDKLEIFLFTSDVVGVIPFFIRAVYIHPHDVHLSQGSQLVLTMMELMIIGRILRVIKDIPAIRAIRIALSKSAGHLVLPLFFFFLFNITAAVFLYFAEPCYDFYTCPWKNLFDTSFFSTVTMTTTGYGNQVPSYELGRFIACCVMIFGSLFLSMPLAIIGNEYDKAWFNITEEVKLREQMKATEEEEIREALMKRKMPLSLDQYNNEDGELAGEDGEDEDEEDAEQMISDPIKELLLKEEAEKLKKEAEDAVAAQSIVMITHRALLDIITQLKSECKLITRVNPVILMRYCELRAWLPALSQHVSHIYDMVLQEKSAEITAAGNVVNTGTGMGMQGGQRRGSVFGPRSSQLPTAQHDGGAAGAGAGAGAAGGKKSLVPSSGAAATAVPVAVGATQHGTAPGRHAVAPTLGAAVISPSQMLMNNNRKPSAGGGGKKGSDSDGSDDNDDEDDEDDSEDSEKGRKSKKNRGKQHSHQNHHHQHSRKGSSNSHGSTGSGRSGHRKLNQHDSDSEDGDSHHKSGEVRDGDLPPHLRRQQSMIQKILPPPTNRKSLYAKVLKAMGVDGESDMRRRSVSEDFLSRMEQISSNPTTLRSRIWILLELPHSSKEARLIQFLIIFLIAVSIFLLYTQTITKLTKYGPTTAICGELLSLYCVDKGTYNHTILDPGCYVQFANGTTSPEKLHFSCEEDNCFGHGYNFGSPHSNLSCLDNGLDNWRPPFQSKDQLAYNYEPPNLFSSRADMHRISAVCHRIECGDTQETGSEPTDANFVWIVSEFTINLIFSVELILRVAVSESVWIFFKDKMNVLDILAVMPFYIELFNTVATGAFSGLDFSILASSPQPIFIVTMRSLKVFRMFKLTRHFQASKVLSETATTVWKQILGMLALMAFFVVLFAIFLFQVEGGKPCFVGDANCEVPDAIKDIVHIGDRILVNKNGQPSQFGNVFFGVWFSFVTITTTGYGDIVPVTNIGQVMAIFLMISGIFYMAMPLTAAASTFYNVHEKYQIKIGHVEASPEPEEKKVVVHEDPMDWKLKLTIKNLIGELFVTSSGINETFKDMQSPLEEEGNNRDGPTMAHANRKQSQMLKTIVRQINNLERSLSNAEVHLRALVLAHHYYMKKANANAALMAKEIEISRSSMPAIGNSAEQRKASRKQE